LEEDSFVSSAGSSYRIQEYDWVNRLAETRSSSVPKFHSTQKMLATTCHVKLQTYQTYHCSRVTHKKCLHTHMYTYRYTHTGGTYSV